MRVRRYGLTCAALFFATGADEQRDWSTTLRRDAQAFHDLIAENHPGPINPLDPEFGKRNDAGLALALHRAKTARNYPGYLWAMRGYVAAFDDGHVALDVTQPSAIPIRWPGFLTGFDGAGRQVVMTRDDDAAVMIGDRLESCDGTRADALAARNVGAFRGRWMLASQKVANGGRLFLDAGNPYVARPVRCRFVSGGRTRIVRLAWRPLPDADFDARFIATAPRLRPAIGARTLGDGTRWYSLSGFDGDPASADAKALTPLIATMRRERTAIEAATRIVLDLRGNGGGSSDWAQQIAAILWGQAAITQLPPDPSRIDWRASAGNLAAIEEYRAAWRGAAGVSQDARDWADRVAAGMRNARAQGKALWREPPEPNAPGDARSAVSRSSLTGKIFVLTDWACGSACLDAVDL